MSRRDYLKNRAVSHWVGLDIGSHSIKGVEVVETGSGRVIRSAGISTAARSAEKQSPAGRQAIVRALKTLWADAGFRTRKIILTLPPSMIHMEWAQFETVDENELTTFARARVASNAPFPANDAIIDYRILSCHDVGLRKCYSLLVAAASSSAVDSLLDLSEKAGLNPIASDIGSIAAARSLQLCQNDQNALWCDQPTAHCIIGATSTSIIVIRGGAMEFARNIPIGGDDFTACIAQVTGVDLVKAERLKTGQTTYITDDGTMVIPGQPKPTFVACSDVLGRLSREILRSLGFFSSHFAEGSYLGMISGLTISGGGSLLRGIDSALRQCGVEVTNIVQPFAENLVTQRVIDQAPAFVTATGLVSGDFWIKDYASEKLAHAA